MECLACFAPKIKCLYRCQVLVNMEVSNRSFSREPVQNPQGDVMSTEAYSKPCRTSKMNMLTRANSVMAYCMKYQQNIQKCYFWLYSLPSKMKRFAKIVNCLQSLTIFAKALSQMFDRVLNTPLQLANTCLKLIIQNTATASLNVAVAFLLLTLNKYVTTESSERCHLVI